MDMRTYRAAGQPKSCSCKCINFLHLCLAGCGRTRAGGDTGGGGGQSIRRGIRIRQRYPYPPKFIWIRIRNRPPKMSNIRPKKTLAVETSTVSGPIESYCFITKYLGCFSDKYEDIVESSCHYVIHRNIQDTTFMF